MIFENFQQNSIKTFRITQTSSVLNLLVRSCCGLANSRGLNLILWKVHDFGHRVSEVLDLAYERQCKKNLIY